MTFIINLHILISKPMSYRSNVYHVRKVFCSAEISIYVNDNRGYYCRWNSNHIVRFICSLCGSYTFRSEMIFCLGWNSVIFIFFWNTPINIYHSDIGVLLGRRTILTSSVPLSTRVSFWRTHSDDYLDIFQYLFNTAMSFHEWKL